MKEQHSLSLKKPVSVLKRKLKINFKQAFSTVGKGLLHLGMQQYIGAGKELFNLLSQTGLNLGAEHRAYFLIQSALVRACSQIYREHARDISLKNEGKMDAESLAELGAQLDKKLDDLEIHIDDNFFKKPLQLPIVEPAREIFEQWMIEEGAEPNVARNLAQRMKSGFVFALHNEWRDHSDFYGIITEKLTTAFSPTIQKELEWYNYQSYLESEIDQSVFGESFSLEQIYIPLRAYFEKVKGVEVDSEKEEREKHAIWLAVHLEEWLNKADANHKNAIRLLSGGPGSGKSSFAKIFAASQGLEKPYRTIMIPLHHFSLSGDLVNAVGDYLKRGGFFTFNPLETEDRILLIFDGLDELSMQGKMMAETARDLVTQVETMVFQINQRNRCRIQVIITGRPLSIQENVKVFTNKERILYLLEYFISEDNQKNYYNKDVLKEDQRDQWWVRFGELRGTIYKTIPNDLKREEFVDITAQPLLNYLVARSFEIGEIKFTEETNLNEIYSDLLLQVYKRDYAGVHKSVESVEFKNYERILAEIALATWHGNGRTTTLGEIQERCEKLELEELMEVFREKAEEGAMRLLTAFYFRRAEQGENSREHTFEFTHKSFGEYLTAKRIVKTLQGFYAQWKNRDNYNRINRKILLQQWIEIFGPQRISPEVLRFIKREITLLGKVEDILQYQKFLIVLLEYCLHNDLPMKGLNINSFQEMRRQAINTESSILTLYFECARNTRGISQINWPDDTSFVSMLKRLDRQILTFEFFDIKHQNLILGIDIFFTFKKCDLSYSSWTLNSLYGCQFIDSKFHNSNFSGTSAMGVIFNNCDFHKSIFLPAALGGFFPTKNMGRDIFTTFQKVEFENSSIKNSILASVNFANTDFEGVSLKDAEIIESNFKNAKNLTYEQLIQAKTLYKSKGLPRAIIRKIKETHPHLLENPEKHKKKKSKDED